MSKPIRVPTLSSEDTTMLHVLLAALLASGSVDARPRNDGAPPATDEAPSSPDLARARWRDAHWDGDARWDDTSVQDDRDLGAYDVDPDASFRFDVPALVRDEAHDARVFPRPSHDGYDYDGYDYDGYDYDGYDYDGYDHHG
jgi:hypothetical protein